jgi:hypothetical protein
LGSNGELAMGNYNVPSEAEIQVAFNELFSSTKIQNATLLAKALLPEDPALNEMVGARLVSTPQLFPQKEMQLFCKQLWDIFKNTRDNGLKIRIALCIYCHIMESDFMFICIWNLLRISHGLDPTWAMEFQTKKRGIKTCEYPQEKIQEIKRLSNQFVKLKFSIGIVLERIWNSEVRNSFSHSNYALLPPENPTTFFSAKAFTPNKRKGPKTLPKRNVPPLTIEDILNYCMASITLNSEFNKQYKPLAEYYWKEIMRKRNINK